MPVEKGDKMAVTIWIDKDVIQRLDRIAENVNLTRSKLIANIVDANLLEVEVFDKTGLLKAAMWVHDMKDQIAHRKKTAGKAKGKK